jgi:hypothetical protein
LPIVLPDRPDFRGPPTPACFGVACSLRARCARYAAVAITQADRDTLPTCVDEGRFPLFLDLAIARFAIPVGSSTGHRAVRTSVRGAVAADALQGRASEHGEVASAAPGSVAT